MGLQGIDYKIDMIRLKTKVLNDNFTLFLEKNNFVSVVGDGFCATDVGCGYYRSYKYNDFKHNFTFRENPYFEGEKRILGCEFSFWIGFQHNMEKPGEKSTLVIEFNPQKCLIKGNLKGILQWYFRDSFEVVSVDVAIDIPVNINDLIVTKGRKKVFKLFDYGQDDKTYYIGEGHGRVKVYNKKIEANLDYELTRYEISLKVGLKVSKLYDLELKLDLEKVFYLNKEYEGDSTFKAILYAVLNGFRVEELTRDFKTKIKGYLRENNFIEVNERRVKSTIIDYFDFYSVYING